MLALTPVSVNRLTRSYGLPWDEWWPEGTERHHAKGAEDDDPARVTEDPCRMVVRDEDW